MKDQGGLAHGKVKKMKNVPSGHRLMDEGYVDNIFANMNNNKGGMVHASEGQKHLKSNI
jgi:hypothetical protein